MLLKEDKKLDCLLKTYLSDVMGFRRFYSPNKGRSGEDGKDSVYIENEKTRAYCPYVIKRDSFQSNLTGKYGILKQMRDAFLIPLIEKEFTNCKRTVVVVYNNEEGNRSAIIKFEKEKSRIEHEVGKMLLSPLERWDIDVLVDKIYPYKDTFITNEEIREISESTELTIKYERDLYSQYKNHENKLDKDMKVRLLDNYINSIQHLNDFRPDLFIKFKKEDNE